MCDPHEKDEVLEKTKMENPIDKGFSGICG